MASWPWTPSRPERAEALAGAAERIYARWQQAHPDRTSLDELAAIYRISGSISRHVGRLR